MFQLHDWDSFRPPVGLWMKRNEEYDIDVSEHENWEFFNSYIRPRIEDRLFMADSSVVDSLIENGSNPQCEHTLEFAFLGEPDGLTHVANILQQRGYRPVGKLDPASGQIVLSKDLALDLSLIVKESIANHNLAKDTGTEFNGWGANVVS